MAIPISRLPRIVETLLVDGATQFVVLEYEEFVTFVADTAPARAPEVVAVLDHRGEHAFVILPFIPFTSFVTTLDFSGTIDERHYLTAHPDVRAAVDQGRLQSATRHYIISGYFERRAVRFQRRPEQT